MPITKARVPVFIVLLAFISVGCGGSDKLSYKGRIKMQRFEKDKHFRYAEQSPLPEKKRKTFRSLDYFPIDTQYRVIAEINRLDQRDTVQMAYTNGEQKVFTKYARLEFNLKGKERSLFAYRNIKPQKGSSNDLFIPFYDKTNGRSSYGGGRYLDIKAEDANDTTILDFNKSYNPYCAYNADFTCPIPPKENTLNIAVPAGEKRFKD